MGRIKSITLDIPATAENFCESAYLAANADVASAVRAGQFERGRQHFDLFGHNEGRRQRLSKSLEEARGVKMDRVLPLLRTDLPHRKRGVKFDFLTEELRHETGIADTQNVSEMGYDAHHLALIDRCSDGLVLDCGSGRKPCYYPNVLNFEIVDYDTTDVIGVGEQLPFHDNAFDGVLSIAVLEHVRDPFRCAAELCRVLKPGGRMICCVPFLQPFHGYPHHYYNMTVQGIRAMFERWLAIDDVRVDGPGLPIYALNWILRSWSAGLNGATRDEFLGMTVREFLSAPEELARRPFVSELPDEKNRELACGSFLFAHKL
jgi:SAM-dependent methyltransferase